MDKKGNIWFNAIFFLVTLFSLTYLFSIVTEKTSVSFNLGDEAALLIDLYQKGDKVDMFLDTAAGNALSDTMVQYFSKGPSSACGDYRGTPLLNAHSKECYPIGSNIFADQVKQEFDLYFQYYLHIYPISLPKEFEIAVYDDHGSLAVTGTSKDSQRLNLHTSSISQMGQVPDEGNVRPDQISDAKPGDLITFMVEGKSVSYYKIGKLPGTAEVDYFITPEKLGEIVEEINKASGNKEITIKNVLTAAPKETLYQALEKRKSDLVSGNTLNAVYSISGIGIGFSNEMDEPPMDKKEGVVYFHDVWEIAKEEDVNYWLILSIIETESAFKKTISYVGTTTTGAHGVMQMFKPAIGDVIDPLKQKEPLVANKDVQKIYEDTFISVDREDVKVQVRAGTLYIKKIQEYLKKQKKPYEEVQVIIQAYHDGSGSITSDGGSKICQDKGQGSRECQESIKYFAQTDKNYRDLRGIVLS